MESIAGRVAEGRRVSPAVFAGLFDESVVEAQAIHAQSAVPVMVRYPYAPESEGLGTISPNHARSNRILVVGRGSYESKPGS